MLPQRDERLEGVERWLGQVLAARPARHVVLQLPLAEVTQPRIDRWLDEGTTYRYALRPFIIWARSRRLTGDIEVPPLPVEAPVTRNSEQAQWEQLRRCLHETTMPLDVRVAGSLLLLFGIRASHRVQADHVEHGSGNTHLRVAEHALLLPPLVAPLVIAQRDREDLRSVFGRASISGTRWLFPGLRPGRAMDPHSLAEKLNDNGINVRAARNTALAELAADLPPPVLAELIGIGLTTATRWARYASRYWSPYLAARIHDQSGPPSSTSQAVDP